MAILCYFNYFPLFPKALLWTLVERVPVIVITSNYTCTVLNLLISNVYLLTADHKELIILSFMSVAKFDAEKVIKSQKKNSMVNKTLLLSYRPTIFVPSLKDLK